MIGWILGVATVGVCMADASNAEAQAKNEREQRMKGLAANVEAFSEFVCGNIRQFARVYRYDEIATKLCDDGLEITLSDSLNPNRKPETFAVTDEGTYRLVGNDWQPVDA